MKLYELNAKIHQSKKHFPFIKNNNVLDQARLRIFSRGILDVLGDKVISPTNRSIKDWPHYLGGDVQCTKASIDRFMRYAIPIKFEGESYRMRKMRRRIATG